MAMNRPDDLTPEGIGETSDAFPPATLEEAWWGKDDLIVSARLDTDGVAASRDPTDLVGRSSFQRSKSTSGRVVGLELQGRGIGGKLVTSKQ